MIVVILTEVIVTLVIVTVVIVTVVIVRAFLWVLIEDLGPHEDLFCEMVLIWSSLEHQVLICSSSSWSGMTLKKVCIFL